MLQSDYYFSSGVSFSHVPESVGDVAQLVTPVDDRCHFSGLEKLSQDHHIRLVELRDKENDLLAATQCRQTYLDDVTQRPDQTVALRCSDDDEGRLRVEYAPALLTTTCSRRHRASGRSAGHSG